MADWFSEPRRSNSGIRRALLAGCVFLAAGVSSAAADSGKVTGVRFWSLGDVTRIAIEVSSDFTFKHNLLDAKQAHQAHRLLAMLSTEAEPGSPVCYSRGQLFIRSI